MSQINIRYSSRPVLEPQPGCEWAEKMVLNPAIVRDPDQASTLHMLFRATGPWPEQLRTGQPMPYPIFLGYAFSLDGGETWEADFSRPALAPKMAYTQRTIKVTDIHGKTVVDHANGCIEDPRMFYFEDELYLSVACRMFPPGPYWEHDDPMQCAPEWAAAGKHTLGLAASANITVTVLMKVDLFRLTSKEYQKAFTYVGPLHNPDRGDNRDVLLFPRRLKIDGAYKIVCLHRPKHPAHYDEGKNLKTPSIFLAAADNIADLSSDRARQHVLATGMFDWEADRIGASWTPMEISPGEWLLPYHGKKDSVTGYTQSFMIIREQEHGFPKIVHRCSERIMYASQPWELEGEFTTPCIFTCGGVVVNDTLTMSYGAADKRIGIATVKFSELLEYIRQFDADGHRIIN